MLNKILLEVEFYLSDKNEKRNHLNDTKITIGRAGKGIVRCLWDVLKNVNAVIMFQFLLVRMDLHLNLANRIKSFTGFVIMRVRHMEISKMCLMNGTTKISFGNYFDYIKGSLLYEEK